MRTAIMLNFVFQVLRAQTLTIVGDSGETRDFVSLDDVVQANLRAAAAHIRHGWTPRPGDLRDSHAGIAAARRAFDFGRSLDLQGGPAMYPARAREAVARA